MTRLEVSVCLSRNILTAALFAGTVVPEGIDWNISAAFAPLTEQEAEIGSAGGLLEPWLRIGALPPDVPEALRRTDPLPYGLRGQERTFAALAGYLREQGLTASEIEIGSLFAESTRDL